MATAAVTPFGALSTGQTDSKYTLRNANGLEVDVIGYGAMIIAVRVPMTDGMREVTIGYDNLAAYEAGHPCLGCVVGRFANRIANGHLVVQDTEYQLALNLPPHHLHGGNVGWHMHVWDGEIQADEDDSVAVRFTRTSPDGEENYPGTVKAEVVYRLTSGNKLVLEYLATTDNETVVNMTNHAYWNLGGVDSRDGTGSSDLAMGQWLSVTAGHVLDVDDKLIPTGAFNAVEGTPLDLRTPRLVGGVVGAVGGLDHCFVLRRSDEDGAGSGPLLRAACLESEDRRLRMTVFTTEPGIQVYSSGNERHAICLEAQHFPDSPNKPAFPSTALHPGDVYTQQTVHAFEWA